MGEGEIVVLYGDVVGMVDIWSSVKLKERLRLHREIIVVRRRPTERVYEEANKGGVEIVVADDPKREAKKLLKSLTNKEGRGVRMKKIEEVGDRSLMLDPC